MSCVICHEEVPQQPVQTLCCDTTLYCRACLNRWLCSLANPTCPNCRRAVREEFDLWHWLLNGARHTLKGAYTVALIYEMVGLFLHEVCDGDWNPVLLLIASLFSSILYTVLLLPAWALAFGFWLARPWPIWQRFQDMCLAPSVTSLFNYRCDTYNPALHGWGNSSAYVVYGHNVYNRAFECTRYVMPFIMIVLQLLMFAVSFLRRRCATKRRFCLRASVSAPL